MKWIDQLQGTHAGETAFLLGNGWSMSYYDAEKMKDKGRLIGCNFSFKKFPLDYLIWQDTKVTGECSKAKDVIKCMPVRKKNKASVIDYTSTYFFGFGKFERDAGSLELANSGCLGFQLAKRLGFETLILVGCDCCMLETPEGYKSNIFFDHLRHKMFRTPNHKPRGEMIPGKRKGSSVLTSKNLEGFAKKFLDLYRRFKDEMYIFRLGDWGILDEIPVIDYPEFYSDTHPSRKG